MENKFNRIQLQQNEYVYIIHFDGMSLVDILSFAYLGQRIGVFHVLLFSCDYFTL